ncbi:MAG: efflux RND transporter permease subunit [Elusimicrobia bacterium]|nr:efflux RND transporter permease subunit [Candidatus Obscuribacterium magneticum]
MNTELDPRFRGDDERFLPMQLSTLFVKRPVMTSMLFMGLALFGVIAWIRLPQELFPNVSVPQLIIITKYATAAPEEIENLITKPIEEAVGTVPNIKRIRSVSREGLSAVILEFAWGTDMGFAHLTTREKLDRIKDRLPLEAEEAIIKRVNPFSHPIMVLSITGEIPLADMTDLCEETIKKKLEKADGVASVSISGGQKREILVEVDRGRLEASRISLTAVVDSIKNANYDYPAGTTQGKVVEYLVRTHGRYTKINDIGKTIVQVENPSFDPVYKWKKGEAKDRSGGPMEQRLIPLIHLAEIKMSLKDRVSFSRYNGRENVSISIQKQADANTVKVSESVREAMKELKGSLPRGVEMNVVYDEANFIVEALGNMRNNVIVGALLAFFVLLFFLGNFRDAVNMGLAIPLSLCATLLMMVTAGISINLLALAGIALSVGMMSDCATCVAENVTRHYVQLKKPLLQAAIDGGNEMVASMLSSTLTNIAVFLPLLFITGIAQQLFQDLFVVTVFTNLASLAISLTFIPRMSAYDWARHVRLPDVSKYVLDDKRQERMNGFYQRALGKVLDSPGVFVQVVILLFALSVALMVFLPKVFMPKMDQGQFIVELAMPVGTKLEATDHMAGKLEGLLSGIEGVNVMVNVGSAQEEEDIDALTSYQAQVVVTLDKKAKLSTGEVIDKFKDLVRNENLEGGHLTYELMDSPLRSALAGGAPIEVEVKGPDLNRLKYFSAELMKKFEADPALYGVKTSFSLASKETQVVVDKDRAAAMQLSVADIAKTALIAIRGMVATTFKEGGKETDIRVRLREADRLNADSIRSLSLRSPQGSVASLDSVARVLPGTGASEIRHLDQQRSVVITAEVSGVSAGQAFERVKKIVAPYRSFKDYTMELGGESRRVAESFSSLRYTFLLAILLIYMIMASQFESLMQPLIIMTTVPFSVIGVAFTLFATNTAVSSVVILGVVILSGIVVNNGIVLIDHINGLRADGMALKEAVMKGSIDRLRPILITSAMTILGVFPMVVGFGKGDELAQPLALITFGGIFISTLLTLLAIPLLYYEVSKWQNRRKNI